MSLRSPTRVPITSYEAKYVNGNLVSSSGPSTTYAIGRVTGSDVVGYRDKLARGQNASSAYSTTWYDVNQSLHYATCYNKYWRRHDRSVRMYLPKFPYLPVLPADVDARAFSAVKRRLANANAQYKALAPIAELREARGLISQVAHASIDVLQAMIALKHGKLRDAAAKASDLWLGFNFGVAPTISDANAAINAVGARLQKEYADIIHVSGKARFSYRIPKVLHTSTSAGDVGVWYIYCADNLSGRVKYSGAFAALLNSANNYSVSQQFGLQFGDIVPAMWELTPYSWALDYFLGVGDFLEDRFTSPSNSTRYLTKSVKLIAERSYFWEVKKANQHVTALDYDTYVDKATVGSFNRSLLAALPHRGLSFHTVDRIAQGGVSKVLNLAAVLLKGGKSMP